jgi:hypothetical protein
VALGIISKATFSKEQEGTNFGKQLYFFLLFVIFVPFAGYYLFPNFAPWRKKIRIR